MTISECGQHLARLRWRKENLARRFGKPVRLGGIGAIQFDARGLRQYLGALRKG